MRVDDDAHAAGAVGAADAVLKLGRHRSKGGGQRGRRPRAVGHNGAPVPSIVPLPPDVRAPFAVYVNGVPQKEGSDYAVVDRSLVFDRELKKEGKLGFWRWFMGAFGVGTYRQNDSVDVSYERNGGPRLVEGLDIEPPE
jgi:hypothetical protein